MLEDPKFSGSTLTPLGYLEYMLKLKYTLGQCNNSSRQFHQVSISGSGCIKKCPPNRPIFCLGQPIFGFYSIATFFDHKTSIFFMNFLITHLDQHLCQPETEYHSVALLLRTLVYIPTWENNGNVKTRKNRRDFSFYIFYWKIYSILKNSIHVDMTHCCTKKNRKKKI